MKAEFSKAAVILCLSFFLSSHLASTLAWTTNRYNPAVLLRAKLVQPKVLSKSSALMAIKQKEPSKVDVDVNQTTEKYGLEAGLFQSMKQNDGGQSAKQLLQKYGIAYLATSIPLALVSFAICYALVDAGVDVAALLSKLGLGVSDTNEKVGTFAIAYAAHKAASPIRFPPTVLLTPVVAKWIGKEPSSQKDDADEQ